MTFGHWPLGMDGYRISQPGDEMPPRTSTPWHAVSLLAVPMVSNHGSWMRKRLVCVSLFKRAWVTAFLLCMFTDANVILGCTAIKEWVLWQRLLVGMRGRVMAKVMCRGWGLDLQWSHYLLP